MTKFYTSISQRGDRFLVREVVNGERRNRTHRGFKPDLFVPTNSPHDKTATGMDDVPLARMKCDSVTDARNLIEQYKDVGSFDVYGSNNWISQFISKEYPGKIEFDPSQIRVFNVDIEVYVPPSAGFPDAEHARFPINLIQLMDSFDDGLVRIWGCQPYSGSEGVAYVQCADEEDLIRKFVGYWEVNCPDVMTGWNIKGFDVPYICNRIEMVLGENQADRLSPWKNVRETTYRSNFGKDAVTHIIDGVAILDYLDLYQKYTYANLESYKLDHVAHVELGDRKVDYSEVGTLHKLYETDFDKFVTYGAQDTRLVDRLDKKMRLIDLVYTLGYLTKQNYTDTFSPVKSWEALIFNYLRDRNKYAKVKRAHGGEQRRIAGAFVKTPEIGKLREWVLSFDLNSLYPHLIAQYNIGTETLVDFHDSPDLGYVPPESMEGYIELNDLQKLVEKKFDLSELDGRQMTMAGNGAFFRTDKKSVMSDLMMGIYATRKEVKKEMLRLEQVKETLKTELESRGISC